MKQCKPLSFLKKNIISSIYFWIFLFFIFRLHGITDPPLEVAHSWRQCFTNAVARFFYENGNSIFYPSASIYGNSNGIVGTEFPVFSYLISVVAKFAGYAHWYGRLINLIFSSIGIIYFYKSVFELSNKKLAFYSSLLLLTSVWFVFSRKSMPDTFSVSLSIIGIYYGIEYFKKGKTVNLLLYFLFITIGVLSKIPSLFLMFFFLYFYLTDEYSLKSKLVFAIVSAFSFLIVAYWYFWWVPYLESLENNRLFFPKGIIEGLNELLQHKAEGFEKFYFVAFQSYVSSVLVLIGLFFSVKNKLKKELFVLFFLTAVFFVFMIKTGAVFPTHSYYIVPFVPVMAIIAAYGLVNLQNIKIRIFLMSVVLIEALLNQQNDFRIKDTEKAKLKLESIADGLSSKDDLVAVSEAPSPVLLYFIHRKGWLCRNEDLINPEFVNSISKKGCKYLFLDKNGIDSESFNHLYKKIFENEVVIVYKL